MDYLQSLILGIVQGITEWLPISSSGHLVIAQEMLGLEADENLLFDLVVHLGSIAAVCIYFRKELSDIIKALVMSKPRRGAKEEALRTLGLLLLVATIPAALVGVAISEWIDSIFTVGLVGAALVVNAGMLFAADRLASRGTKRAAGLADSVVVGLFQVIAIIPGISRSGWTISGGMFRGLERETAATFAFLLSVPILAGAFLFGFLSLDSYNLEAGPALLGFASAMISGLASIGLLLKAVRAGKFWVFGVYCAIVGCAVLVLTVM